MSYCPPTLSYAPHHLYPLLQKIENSTRLTNDEMAWMEREGLLTLQVLEAYCQIDSTYSHVYKAKVKEVRQQEQIQACEHELQQQFQRLKRQYGVAYCHHRSPLSPLLKILQKLEKNVRLTQRDIVWLHQKELYSEEIHHAHSSLNAMYHEQKYVETGDVWNLVNASSDWRKAKHAKSALTATDNIDIQKLPSSRLRSAILTTRGGAFRDLSQLTDAEICARQAIKYSSESYQPYTLMGAISYDRHEYIQGDQWFHKAIKRGASSEGVDTEIQTIFHRLKGEKREQLKTHLLHIDPTRYAWVHDGRNARRDKKRKTQRT